MQAQIYPSILSNTMYYTFKYNLFYNRFMPKRKMRVIPIRLDYDIIAKIDERVKKNIETDRSKEIRKALRKVLFE